MVYTKVFRIRHINKLKQAKDYVENAEKTLVDSENQSEHFDNLFPYVTNSDKTMSRQLVSGYHVMDLYNAANEFLLTKKMWAGSKGTDITFNSKTQQMKFSQEILEKNNAVLARHLVQSFSPEDNLTPEEVHLLGRKTMMEFTNGEYEFIIATHVDKKHIHNHIVVNTTNLLTGKAMPWKISKGKNGKSKDQMKALFEKISDKVAGEAGSKIIEKSPRTSHLKYTKWQTEKIFKSKIQQRLDFLLAHSSDIEDFKLKAQALNLSVDFSGKWSTFKLLDQPQIKNTRGRNLSKKEPDKYNFEKIVERLKENDVVLSVTEVIERYQEREEAAKNDFDVQIEIEPWQIEQVTEKGYYINVDFGSTDHGQIFVGAFKVDPLENGNYNLYLKKTDHFYQITHNDGRERRWISGEVLAKQLALYNGRYPLKKEPVITKLNDVVDAINFLAAHGVTEGTQFENMERQLIEALEEAQEKVKQLDSKILELNDVAKLLLMKASSEFTERAKVTQKLEQMEVSPDLTYHDIQEELSSIKTSRKILKNKLDETVNDLDTYHEIRASRKLNEQEQGKKV